MIGNQIMTSKVENFLLVEKFDRNEFRNLDFKYNTKIKKRWFSYTAVFYNTNIYIVTNVIKNRVFMIAVLTERYCPLFPKTISLLRK